MKTYSFCVKKFMHCSGCVIANDESHALEIVNHHLTYMFPDMPHNLTELDFIEVKPLTAVIIRHFI